MSPIDPGDFLLEDYKQKIAYLTNHFSRMWMRFNFFVSLQTAVVGGGLFFFEDGARAIGVGVGGLALAFIWYVMGAQDRYLVELYRWQVKQASGRLENALSELTGESPAAGRGKEDALGAARDYVGSVEDDIVDRFKEYKAEWAKRRQKEGRPVGRIEALSSWRGERLSTTRLAALIPLIILGLWTLYLIYQVYRLLE